MFNANVVSPWIVFVFLFTCFMNCSATADQINITAKLGDTVTLTCKGPNTNIKYLEWSRRDLELKYVFFLRKNQSDPGNQHKHFENRVELNDQQMKDGDMSLILNSVNNDDKGTYECRIQSKTNRRKRANLDGDPICIINLTVEPGHNRGHVGLAIGLSVAAVVLVVAGIVGFVIYRKGHTQQDSY